MTFVWQIRDRNSGFWIEDSSGGWYHLVTQDKAYLWRREELAEKALKKILKSWKNKLVAPHNYTWFKGFISYPEVIGKNGHGHSVYKIYEDVDLHIVCSKLVPA